MAVYEYVCATCGKAEIRSFPIGKAPREIDVEIDSVKHTFQRVISAPFVNVPGGTKAGYMKR